MTLPLHRGPPILSEFNICDFSQSHSLVLYHIPVGIEGQELSLPVLRGRITYLVISENQHAGLEIGLHDLAPSVIFFLFLSASATYAILVCFLPSETTSPSPPRFISLDRLKLFSDDPANQETKITSQGPRIT